MLRAKILTSQPADEPKETMPAWLQTWPGTPVLVAAAGLLVIRGPPESPCERNIGEARGGERWTGDYIAGAGTLDTAITLSDDTEDSIAVLIGDCLDLEVLEGGGDPTSGVRDLPPAQHCHLLPGLHHLSGPGQTEWKHEVGHLFQDTVRGQRRVSGKRLLFF